MPTLSIITPTYSPNVEYLLAACESVMTQELPAGWDLEWLIQEDGQELAAGILPSDSRIKIAGGRHGGVAITRNLALSRAAGDLVRNLDQDDVLTAGALKRDIEVFESNPEVQWTTSRVLDLMPDGSQVGFDNDPDPGRLPDGIVLQHWREHNYRLPVHPTTICIRRKLAVALGGWMAVPGSDDTGLLIAASVIDPGYFVDQVGILYRKWPGQESAKQAHTESSEWNARMQLIGQRADAFRELIKASR